jgi:O-antigen biosynthesis protein
MWGSGLFQSLYQGTPSTLASLPLVPEWYLVVIALAGISALGALWAPLLLALPLLVLATGALIFEAAVGARRATFHDPGLSGPLSRLTRARLQAITLLLYTLQPLARLTGRLRYGLAPWRRRAAHSIALPRPRTSSVWSEQWLSADQRMRRIAAGLRQTGAAVLHGGEYDRWDLQVRGGILGVARMRMAVEEHGGGRQLVRFGSWPKTSLVGLVLTLCFAALAVAAISSDAIVPAIVMGAVAAALALFALRDCATSTGALLRVLERQAADSRLDAEASLNGKVPARAYAELSRSSEALGEIAHHAQRNGHDDGVEHPATAPASARMLQMSRDRDKEARARQ